jgi:hypothetical protein
MAIGSAAYVTVFVGLMGVVPRSAHHGPAVRRRISLAAGRQLHQAQWLALRCR